MKKKAAGSVTNSLVQQIINLSGNDLADTLEESEIINNKDKLTLPVYSMNIALTGELNGSWEPGLMQVAGPSKHFKTLFGLVLMKAYLDKYEDAVAVVFDSEGGASKSYFTMMGIDPKRVAHLPISNIEELKQQSSKILNGLTRGEKVFLFVDSIGNLASIKEVEDALNEKVVADMSRAKALKSFGRIITPHLVPKNLYMVIINHTYKEIGMFPKDTVGGGTGLYYSSNDIWIISRSQDKDNATKTIKGFNFNINVEKSRTVKEKTKIPVYVNFDTGINNNSGLLDIALQGGFIEQPTTQSYQLKGQDKTKTKKTNVDTLLDVLVEDQDFKDYIKQKYKLDEIRLLEDKNNDVMDEIEEVVE